MDILLNRLIDALKEKQKKFQKIVSTFESDDFYIMVKGSDIFFNKEIQKFLKEKLSLDNFVVLEKILVIFLDVEFRVEFHFDLAKRSERDLQYFTVQKKEFNGYAENKFLNDILGTQKDHVSIYRLFHVPEPIDGCLKFSLNKFASEVCEPILI